MSHWEYWIVGVVGGGSIVALILMLCLEKFSRRSEVSAPARIVEVVAVPQGMGVLPPASEKPAKANGDRACADCGRLFIEGVRKRTLEVNRATGKISYLCEDCLKRREVQR
jgi:hypothetical protein